MLKSKKGFKKPTIEEVRAKQLLKVQRQIDKKVKSENSIYKVLKKARQTLKTAPRLKVKKPKAQSISKLKKKADAVFSQFIRIRDNGKCYTCGLQKDYKQMQNGHFVPRQYLSLRYDETNCHCQCYACNMLYNGQPSAYAKRLEEDYGTGTVARLESKRKDITIWREPEYNALIDKYTALVIGNLS